MVKSWKGRKGGLPNYSSIQISSSSCFLTGLLVPRFVGAFILPVTCVMFIMLYQFLKDDSERMSNPCKNVAVSKFYGTIALSSPITSSMGNISSCVHLCVHLVYWMVERRHFHHCSTLLDSLEEID